MTNIQLIFIVLVSLNTIGTAYLFIKIRELIKDNYLQHEWNQAHKRTHDILTEKNKYLVESVEAVIRKNDAVLDACNKSLEISKKVNDDSAEILALYRGVDGVKVEDPNIIYTVES